MCRASSLFSYTDNGDKLFGYLRRKTRNTHLAADMAQETFTRYLERPPHMKVARIYLRVSTAEQDLTRQADIEHSTRDAGYYIAGVYREKASGARASQFLNVRTTTQHYNQASSSNIWRTLKPRQDPQYMNRFLQAGLAVTADIPGDRYRKHHCVASGKSVIVSNGECDIVKATLQI